MKKIIFMLVLIGVASANADVLAEIKSKNLDASDYEVLEQLYLTASAPATLDDFDLWGEPSNMKCATAIAGRSVFRQMTIPKRIKVTYPARPDRGPLFPGEGPTEQIRFVQIALSNGNEAPRVMAESFAKDLQTETTPTDFNVKLEAVNTSGISSEGVPMYVSIRKNQNYIVEKFVLPNNSNFSNPTYTYCWRE